MATSTRMKLAILYAAKSSPDEHESIPRQLEDGRRLAERDQREVVADYQDENQSAYSGNRGDGLVKAREHAERLASEGHDVALYVQHSDRLARGDGVKAQHLIEIVLWARKAGITIRSVQDDSTDNLIMAVVMGERNHEDSSRKSKSVRSGQRGTVQRGEWRGGILPGGYDMQYEHDERGRITKRNIVFHPEDQPIYDLLWDLARDDVSEQRISLELARRGALTRPVRKGQKRQPFTVNRVSQILLNPFYAGMQPLHGELTPGNWPAYIDFEVFTRLKAERADRGHATNRRVGRPPAGYLLSELATCGVCGGAIQGRSTYKRKKDDVYTRNYLCAAHREYPEGSDAYCAVPPFDAAKVDRMVLANLDVLLADETSALEQLAAGQRDERAKFERTAEAARVEAEAADRAAERATAEFADAVDADERALLKDAAKRKRTDADAARTRMDAALDALALHEDEPQADLAHVLGRMWSALSGDIAGAGDDVKALNAILRENFERVELVSERTCKVVVSPAAIQRHMRDDGRCVLPAPPELTLTVGAVGAERPRFFS